MSFSRKEFIRTCEVLGTSLPFNAFAENRAQKKTNVIIIGGGAAGLTAGYFLKQEGVDFQILEAENIFGGRMKIDKQFTDFPIPLGAEWLHVHKKALTQIVNDSSIHVKTDTKRYNPKDKLGYFEDGRLYLEDIGRSDDQKFVNSSWFDFFNEHIVPHVSQDIDFNTQVTSIDYTKSKIKVTAFNDNIYEADHVIVTVPLKILQNRVTDFTPPLPKDKQTAIKKAKVWPGIKVFIEFKEPFYPAILAFPDSETKKGQRLYYDAAYAQNTNNNIMGMFAVGKQSEKYRSLSEHKLISFILDELDQIFNGLATKTYLKHIIQRWDKEPFIHSAYLADSESYTIPKILSRHIYHKLFFAGEAYTDGKDWGAVHNAAKAGAEAVYKILH